MDGFLTFGSEIKGGKSEPSFKSCKSVFTYSALLMHLYYVDDLEVLMRVLQDREWSSIDNSTPFRLS